MSENKRSTGARIGYFFLALVPFLSFWVIQFGAMIIALIPNLSEIISSLANDNLERYNEIVTDAIPSTVFIMHVIIVLVFGLWYFFGREKSEKNKFRLRGMTFLSVLAMGFSTSFMSHTLVLIQQRFIPDVVEKYEEMAELSGMGINVMTIIAAMLLAPIGEELICRGVTLIYAEKALPFWLANGMQALIFAFMHANLVQGTYAFAVGLILGYSVKKYNSIIPAMMMHFIINSVASMIFGYLFLFIPANMLCIAITSVISAVAVISSFVLMRSEN